MSVASSLCVLVAVLASLWAVHGIEYRTYDGRNNNQQNLRWGARRAQLLRIAPVDYDDGISAYRNVSLPSARFISNSVFNGAGPQDKRLTSAFTIAWASFVALDMSHIPYQKDPSNAVLIPVPKGDAWFDPYSTGQNYVPFYRSVFDTLTGNSSANPRQQMNFATAFIDGSVIYGDSEAQANSSRLLVGGRMKTATVILDNGMLAELVMPNTLNRSTETIPSSVSLDSLFQFGDIRANIDPTVSALATLFALEHNAQAAILQAENPDWTDEQLFQEARRVVAAEIQVITFREFLPALLGSKLPDYAGYNESVNPGLFTEFSSAAFRFGHSACTREIKRLDSKLAESSAGSILRRDSNYATKYIYEEGISNIIRGAIKQVTNAVDTFVVDDIRNFAFGIPLGPSGTDVVSMDIQRGRDHGIPGYNDVRAALGLPRVSSVTDITSDLTVQGKLAAAYSSVDLIDLYVGGLAEDPLSGSMFGPTFGAIITQQFKNVRDGDRFYYENGQFDDIQLVDIQTTSILDIIWRNTALGGEIANPWFVIPSTQNNSSDNVLSTLQHEYAASHTFNQQYTFFWTVDFESIHIALYVSGAGWGAFGLPGEEGGMKDADIIMGGRVGDLGSFEIRDLHATAYTTPISDTDFPGGSYDLFNTDVTLSGGFLVVRASRKLNTGDPNDYPISLKPTAIIFAYATFATSFTYHGPNRGHTVVDFSQGYICNHLSRFGTLETLQKCDALTGTSEWFAKFLVSTSIIFLFVILVLLLVIVLYSESPSIKAGSAFFSVIILVGISLAFIFLLIVGMKYLQWITLPAISDCHLQPWLLGFSFDITMFSMVMKSWRVYRIFHMRKLEVVAIKNSDLAIKLIAMLLYELILNLLWQLVDPLQQVVKIQISDYIVVCDSNYNSFWLVMYLIPKAVIVSIGMFLAVRNRNIHEHFNESKQLGFTIYNVTLFIAAAAITLSILDAKTAIAVHYFLIWLVATITLVIFFGPKVVVVFEKTKIAPSSTTSTKHAEYSNTRMPTVGVVPVGIPRLPSRQPTSVTLIQQKPPSW